MVHNDKKDKMSEKPLPVLSDESTIDEQLKIFSSEQIAMMVPTRKEVLWRKFCKSEEELWYKLQAAAESGASMFSYERAGKPELVEELHELLTEYMGYECLIEQKVKDRINISWQEKLTDDKLSKKERSTRKH